MFRTQNKTSEVADSLIRQITGRGLSPGTRLKSMRQLAQEYSCSTQVIFDALNILEEKRLIVRKAQSGVFVRENPRNVNLEVGLLIMRNKNRNNPFIEHMLKLAEAPWLEDGFNFTIRVFPSGLEPEQFDYELSKLIDRMQLDAVVLLAPFLGKVELEICQSMKAPVVLLGDLADPATHSQAFNQVTGDNYELGRRILAKIQQKNNTGKLVLLTGSRQYYFNAEFCRGAEDFAAASGIHLLIKEFPMKFSHFSPNERISVSTAVLKEIENDGFGDSVCLSNGGSSLVEEIINSGTRMKIYGIEHGGENFGTFYRMVYKLIRQVCLNGSSNRSMVCLIDGELEGLN